MALPRYTVNASLQWNQILKILGIRYSANILPARAECPFCRQNRMFVFDDHVNKGQWYSCQHCSKSGNIIQLAASCWGITEDSTIIKLAKMGFPIDPSDSSLRQYNIVYTRIKRFSEFWERARQNLIHGSTSAVSLIHDLHLSCGVSQDRWDRGLGQLMGSAAAKDVEALFHPHSEGQTRNTSAFRVFKGSKWTDVLAFPFWQLPGKIAGFFFVGRQGDPSKDFVFRTAQSQTVNCDRRRFGHEAGLLMHPRTPEIAASYGNRVVAIADPIMALRMQARNFEASGLPLPLISCWAEPDARGRSQTLHGWKQFVGIRPVIWMPRYDRMLVEQAIVAGARISLLRPNDTSDEGLWRYITQQQPQVMMRKILEQSKPWPEAMTALIQNLDDGDVEDLFYYLEMDNLDPARVLERCEPKARKHFRAIAHKRPVRRTVPLSANTLVVEIEDSWFIESTKGNSPLLSDAIIRIDDVIHSKTTGYTYYQGTILHQGKSFSFCEAKDTMRKNPWEWLESFLEVEGYILSGSPKHGKELISTAIQFHRPKHSFGVDTVGWDLARGRFLLPHYYLTADGEAHTYETTVPTPGVPGHGLSRPVRMSPAELEATVEDPSMAGPLWSCFIAAMANILAPAYKQPTSGIGLMGAGAELAGGGIAEAMGCNIFRFGARQGRDQAAEIEQRHGWPVLVQAPVISVHRRQMFDWLNLGGTHRHNCLVPLNWLTAQAKMLFGGWHIVRAEQPIVFSTEVIDAFRRLTTSYLGDLASRRFKLAHWSFGRNRPWLVSVAKDIKQFVAPHLPNWSEQVEPKRWLTYETRKVSAEPLGKILGYLASEGKLLVGIDGPRELKRPTLLQRDDGLLLSRIDLFRLLEKERILLVNPARVTAALANSNAMVGLEDHGWLLKLDWWEKQLARFSAYEEGRLRIVR